jgi:hypothetical protein
MGAQNADRWPHAGGKCVSLGAPRHYTARISHAPYSGGIVTPHNGEQPFGDPVIAGK